MRPTYQTIKDLVLVAACENLYFYADFEACDAADIHKRVSDMCSPGLVRRALSSLSDEGLIKIDSFDETSPYTYSVTDEGLAKAEEYPTLAQLLRKAALEVAPEIPASDRTVSLDHNKPEYAAIADALDNAIEQADQTKPNDVSGDQHASLIAGLRGARELWNSFELTHMQVRVGVLMALETAQEQLAISFKMARGTLLVEAIKLFINAACNAKIL